MVRAVTAVADDFPICFRAADTADSPTLCRRLQDLCFFAFFEAITTGSATWATGRSVIGRGVAGSRVSAFAAGADEATGARTAPAASIPPANRRTCANEAVMGVRDRVFSFTDACRVNGFGRD